MTFVIQGAGTTSCPLGWFRLQDLNTMRRPTLSILTVSLLVASTLFLMSNSSGVAHQQNKDRTGAPGSDNTCQQCHAGGNYNPDIQVYLALPLGGGTVGDSQYVPGAVHTVVVEVSSNGTPAGYGVHGAVVFADGSDAGELIDQEPNDCIWLDEVDGRSIFEQNDLCSSGSFEVQWVAPPAGSGPVSIYVAAIAANGNSTSSGDNFIGGQFDFDEGVNSSVEEVDVEPFTVVSAGEGRLDVVSEQAAQCAVFSLDGRVLFEGHLEAGRATLGLDHTGFVVVRMTQSDGTAWTDRIWMNP